jgi:hypothetical protein
LCIQQTREEGEKPFLPKKLKFEEGDETAGLNKTDENGKGAILFSLAPADQPLVDRINKFNDERLDTFKMYGPEFKIVSGKKVGSVFCPKTGNVEIRFRTFPFGTDENNKAGKVFTLSLDSYQFNVLIHLSSQIMELIYSVEGKNHPDYPGDAIRSPKEILRWEEYPGRSYSNFGEWSMCRLEFIDDLYIDLRWHATNKETHVKIYRGADQKFVWKAGENAVSMRGGGFEVFVRNLIPKLRNSVRYWSNVHKAGGNLWDSLSSTYEPRHEFYHWGKQHSWWMPVEDEDLYGDYEERAERERVMERFGQSEDANCPWAIVEEEGRSYYAL